MTFAISWFRCIFVEVREFVRAWVEIGDDKMLRRALYRVSVSPESRAVVNNPRHATRKAKLVRFSFRWSRTQEITRKRRFLMCATNWISTPLCNDAGDRQASLTMQLRFPLFAHFITLLHGKIHCRDYIAVDNIKEICHFCKLLQITKRLHTSTICSTCYCN